MSGWLPDRFKCPVCLEIPHMEIVQCKNGHTYCINCSQDLPTCPKCRLIFETPKIRNRALEDLLDTMKFSCEHKALGCTAELSRKDISSHVSSCLFGSLPQAISDLKQNTAFISCRSTNVDIHLTGLDKLAVSKRSMWSPVLIEKEKKLFIILCSLIDYGQTLSVSCLEIGKSGSKGSACDYKAMFCISPINSEENPEITWTTKPVQIKPVTTEIHDPVFRFSFRLLSQKYSRSNSIVLKCSILKPRTCPQRLEVVTAINTPCANFQPGFSLEEWLKCLSVQGAACTETHEERTGSQTVQQSRGPSLVATLQTATATPAPRAMGLTSGLPTQPGPSTSQTRLVIRKSKGIPPAKKFKRNFDFPF